MCTLKYFLCMRLKNIHGNFSFLTILVHFENRSFVCGDDNQLSVEMTKFKYSHISIRVSLMSEIVENYENSFKKQ